MFSFLHDVRARERVMGGQWPGGLERWLKSLDKYGVPHVLKAEKGVARKNVDGMCSCKKFGGFKFPLMITDG